MSPQKLRRLIDLPGVADLEFKAVMKPRMADPDARPDFPEIDQVLQDSLGLTGDQAEATELPAGLKPIDALPPMKQVEAFEAVGWDVTDNKRKPLRLLGHLGPGLWLAIHGVAGQLPFQPEDDPEPQMRSNLAAEAAKFRRDRR
jgi:hypothetical protein